MPTNIRKETPLDNSPEIVLDLGCGNNKHPGAIGIDARKTTETDIVADLRRLPVRRGSVTKVICEQVLEHFRNPYPVLSEIHRVLKNDGSVLFSVPNWGTHSAAADPSHEFLVDLYTWSNIFNGYFRYIKVTPYGTKFQSVTKKWIRYQKKLINDGFYELAQGFNIECSQPQKQPKHNYHPWWLEEGKCRRKKI